MILLDLTHFTLHTRGTLKDKGWGNYPGTTTNATTTNTEHNGKAIGSRSH